MSEELKKVSKEEVEFNKLQEKKDDLIKRAQGLKIHDATTLQIATQVLSEVKEFNDKVEAKRKELKEPYHKAGKAVDDMAKKFSVPLEAALTAGKSLIMQYNTEQEKKAKEKQEKLNEIRIKINNYSKTCMIAIDHAKNEKELKEIYEKEIKAFPGKEKWGDLLEEALKMRTTLVDYIKQAKIDLLTPEQADTEVKEILKEVAEVQQQEIADTAQEKIEAAAFVSSTKFREGPMKFKLVDASQVPPDWWIVDEEKVKAFIKEHKALKAGDKIHGFEFYREQSVVIK